MKNVLLIVSLAVGVLGALQSVAVLPYRMTAAEAAVTKLQTDTKTDREILIRIEERLKTLQEKLERKP